MTHFRRITEGECAAPRHCDYDPDRNECALDACNLREWPALADHSRGPHGNGNGYGKSLSIEALRLLPTPTAMDSAGSRGHRPVWTKYTATSGVTLTDAALASSGAHTSPRSNAGNTSSDDPLPGQLSLDATGND